MIVSIVIEVNNPNLDQPFSYLVDFAMQDKVKIGQKVIVPFGNRDVEGFVLNIEKSPQTSSNLKYIKSVTNDYLNEEQLMFVKYLRDHNAATMIECINTILPPAFRASIRNKSQKKFIRCLRVINNNGLNEKESLVVEYLLANENTSLKKSNELFGNYIINKLRKNQVIEVYEIEDYRLSIDIKELNYYETLTVDQERIVNEIDNSKELVHLIYGKTGSGKTVCYLELIKRCLLSGKEVLLLVPEISLTTQLINILSYHFMDDIAVFHSGMSSNERYDQYRKIIDNKVKVAIGTRSSIFLPFTNLGLIIIDEEHDDSYIQESKVSYSTKELAMLRLKSHDAKIILGSATPDVSTYNSALNNKIVLHKLNSNYSKSNVKTEVVNMKSNFEWIISTNLKNHINNTISKNEQFILLLNRRGYANYLICNECGSALKCPNCDVTLNLHKNNLLKCHQCDYQTYSVKCECGKDDFSEYGYGLQKVEEVLNEMFTDLKIARVDTDVLKKTRQVSKIFNDFTLNYYDGLIGTQILSKGLNFTNVSLVAIIDADYMLNINSYKSSEKTFQYIKQSLGRNARGNCKECTNIVQTYDTTHYALTSAINDDYEHFFKKEIEFRKRFNYPPFTKYTKILATSSNLSLLVKLMNELYNECVRLNLNPTKPHFANIEKINMQYRIQILIKHSHFSKIFGIINKIREYNKQKEIKIIINNNPIDF